MAQDVFSLLGTLMNMKEQAQRIRLYGQQEEDRQRDLDDDAAIRTTLQKFTPIDQTTGQYGNPDFDKALNTLYGTGRGSAATKLQNTILDWNTKQLATLQQRNTADAAAIKQASMFAQGITDDATFARAMPQIASLLGKQRAMQIFGDRYDKNVIEQAMTQGETSSEHLARMQFGYSQAEDALKHTREAIQDQRDWADKLPAIQKAWTNAGSGFLSTAQSQQDWDNGLKMLNQGMMNLSPDERDMVIGQFGATFSPVARERARLLGMTQNERSNERQENQRITQAGKADDQPLTPEATEMLADMFARTGTMPTMGQGGVAASNRKQIFNAAAKKYQGLDLASMASAYKANVGSLVGLQANLDKVKSFEKTAFKNLDTFIDQAQKVVDSGSPLINRGLRSFSDQVLGSPTMAAYNAARQIVIPEFTRIMNSTDLKGQMTVNARKEMDAVIRGDATLAQILNVAKVLKADSDNRVQSAQDMIDEVNSRISATPNSVKSLANADSDKGASGLPKNFSGKVKQNGIVYEVKTDASGNIISQRVAN